MLRSVEGSVPNRTLFFVLMALLFVGLGCSALRKNFGAPKITPELKAAEDQCTERAIDLANQKEKDRGEKYSFAQKYEVKRIYFKDCMHGKGYDRMGRRIEGFEGESRKGLNAPSHPRNFKQYEQNVPSNQQ